MADSIHRILVENAGDILSILQPDGKIRYLSPASQTVLGYAPAALEGTLLTDWVWHEDLPECEATLQAATGGEASWCAVRLRTQGGDYAWVEILMQPFRTDDDQVQLVACCREITARKQVEEQWKHQAFHDPVTGLPNRVAFTERLRQSLARCLRHDSSLTVLLLDLDNFQWINDTLGHDVGERLLCGVADRLRATLRQEDTPARYGNDEFTILLEDGLGTEATTRVAERVSAALLPPFALAGREIHLSFSIGIARSSREHRVPADLLRDADVAMYAAKSAGKGRYALFDPTMSARGLARQVLETDLRGAAERGELRLHYQPIVDLPTGKMIGVEALVRWQHPERGLIPPLEFIPIAEECGFVRPLSRWILAQACRQAALWLQQVRGEPFLVSVNLSRLALQSKGLVDEVREVLQETGLPPGCLQLEVTEGAMMEETEAAIGVLQALKRLGVRLAMDDFGTGYSSFSYLKRFPIDVLKIDRSFISGLASQPEDRTIMEAMITLARTLRLQVVAEGVETGEHLARLRELGCECGQGYYFSRPLPADKLAIGAR